MERTGHLNSLPSHYGAEIIDRIKAALAKSPINFKSDFPGLSALTFQLYAQNSIFEKR
jgi:hypothetical protein